MREFQRVDDGDADVDVAVYVVGFKFSGEVDALGAGCV
jgi:hypothetical protein